MKPRFPSRSEAPAVTPGTAAAAAADQLPAPGQEFRACCCPGRPVVRVIMPASASRPRAVDLLLCGHHYRVAQAAVTAAHGTTEVLPGRSADALLTKLAVQET